MTTKTGIVTKRLDVATKWTQVVARDRQVVRSGSPFWPQRGCSQCTNNFVATKVVSQRLVDIALVARKVASKSRRIVSLAKRGQQLVADFYVTIVVAMQLQLMQ